MDKQTKREGQIARHKKDSIGSTKKVNIILTHFDNFDTVISQGKGVGVMAIIT